MPLVRIAAATVNQTPIDWEGNLARCASAVQAAREAGAQLVCLPELCLSGYGCEDLFFAKHVRERAQVSLKQFAKHTAGIAATVGLPWEIDGRVYNAEAMVVDGQVVGLAMKQHLANDGIHYEARWFTAWPEGTTGEVDFDGRKLPAGELVFDFDGVGLGMEICRDAWVEIAQAHRFAELGVSVVLNPSASHFAFGKQAIRDKLAADGAVSVNGLFVYTNLLGNESGRAIFGGDAFFAQANASGQAEVFAGCEPFSCREFEIAVIDAEVEVRAGENRISTGHSLAPTNEEIGFRPVVRSERLTNFQEFSRAVPLGLLDYLRKSGAQGFVLSLSGGADSAACAVLVWLMMSRAIKQIGIEGVIVRLPATAGLPYATDARQAVNCLLTTVYQGTRNSSQTTREAAQVVANTVGAEHHTWMIDTLVDDYVDLAEKALDRDLSWESDDLALQNIQARVRAPGVWMLANIKRRY